MTSLHKPLSATARLYDESIAQLRQQVWIGVLLFTLFALFSTRLVRYLSGVESTPIAIVVQVILYVVVIGCLWLRNSRHAPTMQTIFLACIHVVVPVVVLLYGGTQGFGDVTLFLCIVISAVFGWRRWMYVTFAISSIAVIYTLYLELIGQPLSPFINDTARFASLKVLIFISLVTFIIWMGHRFYGELVNQYQLFADEQLRLTGDLQQSTQQLTQLSAELTQSRQVIVTSREEERRRLRRELEDLIGPTLASLSYRAGAARYSIQRQQQQPQQANLELDALESNIKETLSQVRTFVYALHPPMLDQLGLAGAIHQAVAQLKLPFSAEINTEEMPKDLNAAAEVVTFELVQTVLDCTKSTLGDCTLDLAAQADTLDIDILLDGSFSAESLRSHPAMQTVFSRIDEVGGDVTIESTDSAEIQLHGTIPL